MGEKNKDALKLQFDKGLRLEFHGARITSEAGLLACRELDGVLNIDVDRELLIKRLLARRVCKVCGADYNVITHPSKQEGVCDRCGGQVIQRADDNEDTIRNRLEVYERQTAPLKGFYTKWGLLKNIDGRGSIDDVFTRVVDALAR